MCNLGIDSVLLENNFALNFILIEFYIWRVIICVKYSLNQ